MATEQEAQKTSTKDDHEQLTAIIKGVHKHLRREYRANNLEHEGVWQKHSLDHDRLQMYATAMHRLATEHWSVYPETRIDWCRKVAVEFFLHDGLRVALEKDAKRKFHEVSRCQKQCSDQSHTLKPTEGTPVLPSAVQPCDTTSQQTDSLATIQGGPQWDIDSNMRTKENHSDHGVGAEISLPFSGKIRLLDVGSCYNPFLLYEEFDVLAVDLSPAVPTVLQCDFLQLETSVVPPPHEPLAFDLRNLSSPLLQLPRCSFHAVVFSLLLEYLPSTAQRLQCCIKAHSLLAGNGLLLVVTPDSHSQHRNAPMMKSWKQALESLGFIRWKYEKKDHIHCMAFRKTSDAKFEDTSARRDIETSRLANMLYIPQDFNDACYDDVPSQNISEWQGISDSEDFVLSTIHELPLFDVDSDGIGDEENG